MELLRFLLFYLLLRITGSTATEDKNVETTLTRILRDITGQYHPELHGEHGHRHAHTTTHAHGHDHDHDHGTVNALHISTIDDTDYYTDLEDRSDFEVPKGYFVPTLPPPTQPPSTPNGYANCGCVPNGQCAPQVVAVMGALLQVLKNDVVCGTKFDLCCYDDPWPGPIDAYKPVAPCVPTEYCVRPYGSDPYDIQNYGVIGPCIGLGSVRCLDNKPPGPSTIVVPIYNPPPPPTPAYVPPPVAQPPPVVYEPPVTVPPVVYEPPVTVPPVVYEPPVTVPPTVYEPPATVPPVVYEPPVTVPPTVYEPPVTVPPVVYEPPATLPPVVYEPPATLPPVVYEPPTVYEPPVTETYEPPVDTYVPPTPVETYEPPTVTYEPPIPVTSYGVPSDGKDLGFAAPRRYFGGRYLHGGYRSRLGFGYPLGLGGYGGFRKRFHFSKGFFG